MSTVARPRWWGWGSVWTSPLTVLRGHSQDLRRTDEKILGIGLLPPLKCRTYEYACPSGTFCNIFRKPMIPVSRAVSWIRLIVRVTTLPRTRLSTSRLCSCSLIYPLVACSQTTKQNTNTLSKSNSPWAVYEITSVHRICFLLWSPKC